MKKVQPNWRDECLALLRRHFPRSWRRELFNMTLRAIAARRRRRRSLTRERK